MPVRPLGLTQQDYEELENPSRAAEPVSPLPSLTWGEECLFVAACAFFLTLIAFFYVTALLCRMVTGRWPR